MNDKILNNYLIHLSKKNISQNSKQRFMSSFVQFVNWHNEYYPNNKIEINRIDIKSGVYLPDTIQIEEVSKLINYYDHNNFLHSSF